MTRVQKKALRLIGEALILLADDVPASSDGREEPVDMSRSSTRDKLRSVQPTETDRARAQAERQRLGLERTEERE